MVVLDNNGDREPDYWISDMDPTTGIFVKIAEVLNTDNGIRVFVSQLSAMQTRLCSLIIVIRYNLHSTD